MGRIDEALRRARAPLVDVSASKPGADVFVSVWGESGQTVERAIRSAEARRDPATEFAPASPSTTTLAVVPLGGIHHEWREKLALTTTHDGVMHQFRRLAAVLVQAQRSRPLRTIMVTSALPGDGKTLTSVNLGVVLSESYRRRVVLVEADFRRPRIGSLINLPIADGLSDIMKSPEDRKVRRVLLTPNLTLVPAGSPDADPVSGLTSARMQEFLLSAAEEFDWVILDTPPVSVAADAALLSPFTDATILVVRAGHTPNAAVQQAVEAIGRERIVGVVLNGAEDAPHLGSDYYYGSTASSKSASDLYRTVKSANP